MQICSESNRTSSGVLQESVRSPSGVRQESIRSQSGIRQESVKSQSEVFFDFASNQFGELILMSGFCWYVVGFNVSLLGVSWGQSGVRQELVRSPSGVGQESVRSQSGVSQESVRSLLGFC